MEQNKINNERSTEFMLEEFRFLKASYEGTLRWREERFKSFVNLLFGLVGVLTIVAQLSSTNLILNYSVIIISLITYLYGWFVFLRLVPGTISLWRYEQAIHRVRQYFVDMDSHIHGYLLIPTRESAKFDKREKMGSGLVGTTAAINSLLSLVLSRTFVLQFLGWNGTISILIGIILAILSWFAHYLYYTKKMVTIGQG